MLDERLHAAIVEFATVSEDGYRAVCEPDALSEAETRADLLSPRHRLLAIACTAVSIPSM